MRVERPPISSQPATANNIPGVSTLGIAISEGRAAAIAPSAQFGDELRARRGTEEGEDTREKKVEGCLHNGVLF